MNSLLAFLDSRRHLLTTLGLGNPLDLSCLLITPRFRTSSHIVVFVTDETARAPVLVAKVPRLAGDNDQLEREERSLRSAQAIREGGFESIPRVVAFDDWGGYRFLVETVVDGTPLRPAQIRRRPKQSVSATLDWLIEFQCRTVHPPATQAWHSDLVERPLSVIERALPEDCVERESLELTRRELAVLKEAPFPLVFEHGDFAPPNILLNQSGGIGVVDWELAIERGLPLTDALMFLTWVAFSMDRARNSAQYVAAVERAFISPDAWATPHIARYCSALELNQDLVRPLFVLCWARYVANIITRLRPVATIRKALPNEIVEWIRSNRYFSIWQFALRR